MGDFDPRLANCTLDEEINLPTKITIDSSAYETEEEMNYYKMFSEINDYEDIKVELSDFVIDGTDLASVESSLKLPKNIVGNYSIGNSKLQLSIEDFKGITVKNISEVKDGLYKSDLYKFGMDVTALELLAFSIMKSASKKLKVTNEDFSFFIVDGVGKRIGDTLGKDLQAMICYIMASRGFLGTCRYLSGGLVLKFANNLELSREEILQGFNKNKIQENIIMDVSKLEYNYLHEALITNVNKLPFIKGSRKAFKESVSYYNTWKDEGKRKDEAMAYLYFINTLAIPSLPPDVIVFKDRKFSKDLLLSLSEKVDKLYNKNICSLVETIAWPAIAEIFKGNEDYDYFKFDNLLEETYEVCTKMFREDGYTYIAMKGFSLANMLNLIEDEVKIKPRVREGYKPELEENFVPKGHIASDEVAATVEGVKKSNFHNDLDTVNKLRKRDKVKEFDNKYNVSHASKKVAKGAFFGTALLGKHSLKSIAKGFKFANKNKKDTAFALVLVIGIIVIYLLFKRI